MVPQRTKLVIFDCDGVLVDSELLASRADVAALRDCGISAQLDEVLHGFTGKSIPAILAWIRMKYALVDPQRFLEAKKRHTEELFRQELQPVPGVVRAMEYLQSRGLPFCVASNSQRSRLELTLQVSGLLAFVGSRFYSADSVRCGKPAPDIYLYAAGKNQVRPQDCLVVEDSPTGVTAAKAAGMYCAAFTGTNHLGDSWLRQLKAAGADVFFHDFSEFPSLLPETP